MSPPAFAVSKVSHGYVYSTVAANLNRPPPSDPVTFTSSSRESNEALPSLGSYDALAATTPVAVTALSGALTAT